MVLISVVMPTYNHEQYIKAAIDSVLNQTFRDFEFIIVEDKSTDNSQKIIKNYLDMDKRIKIIFHKKNEGAVKALNDGINASKGKYIAIICSDDIWNKNKLEKQLSILKRDENLIVWSEGKIIDSSGNLSGETFTQRFKVLSKIKSGDIFQELMSTNFICFSTLIFKKKNLGKIKFHKSFYYHHDYQIEADLAKKYRYYFIEEPLAQYRIHETNLIRSNRKKVAKELIKLRTYFLKKYGNELPRCIKWHLNLEIVKIFIEYKEKKNTNAYINNLLNLFPISPIIYLSILNNYIYSLLRLKIFHKFLKFYRNLFQNLNFIKTNSKFSLYFNDETLIYIVENEIRNIEI